MISAAGDPAAPRFAALDPPVRGPRRVSPAPGTGVPHAVSITSSTDDQAHQVTDTELATGVVARRRYRPCAGTSSPPRQ
jgi:hypothetical protein